MIKHFICAGVNVDMGCTEQELTEFICDIMAPFGLWCLGHHLCALCVGKIGNIYSHFDLTKEVMTPLIF